MNYTVFLSHNAGDNKLVSAIIGRAQAVGVRVYTYEQDPQPGHPLSQKLMQRISEADALVAVLTRRGVYRPAVQQEIGVALQQQKPVIPIVEKGVAQSELGLLQGVEYLEFDGKNPDTTLLQLQRRLSDLRSAKALGRFWLGVFVTAVATALLAGGGDSS